MKTSFLALTAFTFVATRFALAQDPTISIPTEQSEAAAAEASETPENATTKSGAPGKTASKAPKESVEAAPSKKSTSPAPAAAPEKKMGAEATVRDLENKWVASVATHDPAAASKALAEDYSGVSARGQVMSKRALLAQIKKDSDTYSSSKIGKMDVRLFGNTAVVIGTSTETGKDSRGLAFNRAYRWTDTWVLRNGAWQCVASQSTQVPR
jgi:ketosteroid isomerase-like protein